MPTAEMTWPSLPSASAAARRLMRDSLAVWHCRGDQGLAELAVSELVSNAVRHAGGGDIRVCLDYLGGRLLVEVQDGAPGAVPHVLDPDPDDDHGRGMLILDRAADGWGVRVFDDYKIVWCVLRLRCDTAQPD
jgi:anti-sigma regulatory factor (Ser/Thr protein kinase)